MLRAAIWPALLTIVLFAQSLGGGFLYDDEAILVDDTRVVTATPRLAFTTNFFNEKHNWQFMYYRPLWMLSYSAIYRVFGLSPFAFHASSILWNALAAACFYWMLLALGYRKAIAMAASLLFAVHPLHVESVAWMSALESIQSDALMIMAMLCVACLRRVQKPRALPVQIALKLLGLLCGAAAMLTKESAVILPALIFLIAFYRQRLRDAIVTTLPYCGVALAYLAVRARIIGSPPAGFLWGALARGWRVIPSAAAHTVQLLFWPWPLAVHYEPPQIAFTAVILIAIAAWLVALWKFPVMRDNFALGTAIVAVGLAIPVMTAPLRARVLQIGDRLDYVATAGACLIVAILLSKLPGRGLLFGCLFLVPMGALGTYLQADTWSDAETMWKHTLVVTPTSEPAASNLAYTLYVEQRYGEAEKILRQAVAYHPQDKNLRESLANMEHRTMAPPDPHR